jgi:hypothetical protein
VADAMLDSRTLDPKTFGPRAFDPKASRAVAFTESIWLDCSDSRLPLRPVLNLDKCPSGPLRG